MNVIVSNKNQGLLNSLDIDVIKSINGEFTADEIISTFSNFFFNRMFLDITAIKDYYEISNIQKISMGLEMDKVILLLDNNLMNNNSYLSQLISMGIYNFANNKESLMYLYNHPNTYKDVAHIHQLNSNSESIDNNNDSSNPYSSLTVRKAKIVGFKNLTAGAGATTLIYMIKKELSKDEYVVAIEVNKNDFGYFNEKDMYSINVTNIQPAINKFSSASMVLVDLNNTNGEACDEVIYLIEPSTIKLNKMTLLNKDIFDEIYGKRIVLKAEEYGISVVCCVENFGSLVGSGKLIIKPYDSITYKDLEDCHYVVDAKSFLEIRKFSTDLLPVWHLLEILKDSKIKLLEIGSCAFLYTDKTRNKFVGNEDDYTLDDEQSVTDRLSISAFRRLSLCKDVKWSVLCPPLLLDKHGYGTGVLEFSDDVLSVGLGGDSYISLVDLAKAVVELLKLVPKDYHCVCVRSIKK